MARRRASMREGPLAELFRATEAAQRQQEQKANEETAPPAEEPEERTVEHVPTWEEARAETPAPSPPPPPIPPPPVPDPTPPPPPRYVEPMPEAPPRLYRAPQDTGAYLAVIKVVGVGGA